MTVRDPIMEKVLRQQFAAIASAMQVAGKRSRLPDGTTGYHMSRTDDCWEAAVATCTQIPLDHAAHAPRALGAGGQPGRRDG